MEEIKRIQTLQYMGSKSRMLNVICDPILHDNSISTVVDLFSGTGSVGYALSFDKHIISNDLEKYAFVINEAILNGCMLETSEIDSLIKKIQRNLMKSTAFVEDAIVLERKYLEGSVDAYHDYAFFSENTPSIFNPMTSIPELKTIEELVSHIIPGEKSQTVPFPCLFLTYYANAYFGIMQCCQIDAIASEIQKIPNDQHKNVLLAALMSALSICASTTTHFAQFLKVKSKGTFKNIKEKRQMDVIELFSQAVDRFRSDGILNKGVRNHECYNLDYAEFLTTVDLDEHTIVYADPPYFKEHYSRYYHVLNTLCFYDYPAPDINPQTKLYSVGRYRTDRNVSDFGKKAKVIAAFNNLINLCADKKVGLIISYSENSLVKIYELLSLAEKRYRVRVEKVELMHSSQGRVTETDQKVKEYLFFCEQPDSKDVEIERAAEEIRKVKPIVDNPGGFLHNYMARKPYNVVSKIIELLTNNNDVVFDPMFGSGTTLIEASKLGRYAIGCDINPIAYKICRTSLTRWNQSELRKLVKEFLNKIESECAHIYDYDFDGETRVIERCHFDLVDGVLIPTKYWYKAKKDDKLFGRKQDFADSHFIEQYNSYGNYKINRVKNKKLIPNSRIAIKDDASVFNYFCKRNLLALDRIFTVLENYSGKYGYEVLETIVSSAINLIKLSDKKASSQMPYWLPQKDVTSRNAFFIIQQKAEIVLQGLEYLDSECKRKIGDGIQILNVPAQKIDDIALPDESVNLILTDPPYTDQVPYLEYSQLWFDLFNIEKSVRFTSELVVSDAPSRGKNDSDFGSVMKAIIRRSSRALKQSGIFVMFYHSFDLQSWANILSMMQNEGLKYSYQIPTAAPRKSFKTVMSPRSTLDGNYLVFFVKENQKRRTSFSGTVEDALDLACKCASGIIQSQEHVTTQDLYDRGMLKDAFEKGYLDILARNYKTFADVVKKKLKYTDGYWEE